MMQDLKLRLRKIAATSRPPAAVTRALPQTTRLHLDKELRPRISCRVVNIGASVEPTFLNVNASLQTIGNELKFNVKRN